MLNKSRPEKGWASHKTHFRLAFLTIAILLTGILLFLTVAPAQVQAVTTSSSLDAKLRQSLEASANSGFISASAPSVSQNYNLNIPAAKLPQDIQIKPTEINGQQFQYFSSTGHSLSGPLLQFYLQSGSTARHGLPLTEILSVNKHYWQFFQNSVVEFDPEYIGTSSEAKLVPLGQMLAAQYDFPTVTPFKNTADRWYFPETGHSLNAGFLNFWLNNGDRASLGLPVSEEVPTQDPTGQPVTYQYFQYVRLEYHPNATDLSQSIVISPLGEAKAAELVPTSQLSPVALTQLTSTRQVHIPSLMFHYIRVVDQKKDPLGFGLSVTPDNFVSYLDYLQNNGFHTVTIGQIYDYLRYGIPLPDKPINLRFDDGYISHWFAYQELLKRGMTATFFVVTRRLELTPQQWQQIDQDGFEVAAHTRNHPDLKGVSNLQAEIAGSKTDLEAMLGHPVRTFAFPYGSYTDNIVRVVRDSGFDVSASTNGGLTWNLDKVMIEPTLGITGRDTLGTFISKAEMRVGDVASPSGSSSPSTSNSPKNGGGKSSGTTKTATPVKSSPKPTAKPTTKAAK